MCSQKTSKARICREAVCYVRNKHGYSERRACVTLAVNRCTIRRKQGEGRAFRQRPVGTLGDIGVYSLNYHKHIHSGEGGVIVTNDDTLAQRLTLIRNYAEAVVEGMEVENLCNMVGFNFRMTELDAAVARCQLPKLAALNEKRLRNVAYLEVRLRSIPCLTMPAVRPGAEHVYYVHACIYDEVKAGIPATRFVEAVKAELPHFHLREKEGVKLSPAYVKPLYLLPLFQKRIAFGRDGWPFTLQPERKYEEGLCLVCERLQPQGVLLHEFMLPSMEEEDLDDVARAFEKVWEMRGAL